MPLEDENELVQARLEKLRRLRETSGDPFAVERYDRTHSAAEAIRLFEAREADPDAEPQTVRVAGRIFSIRNMGKAAFFDLRDESGRIQLYFKVNGIGRERFEQLDLLDHSDFLGAEGTVFRTRTGEVTLEVRDFQVLAKAVRPLPLGKTVGGEHHGDVTDVELRYRQRYADLAVHPEVRQRFRQRSLIVRGIREFLDERGYVEVETPVLQSVAGGAAARPFTTHHNALDYDFHLRISLELYLKRLIVGGFEKVYEIGRVFRNEGTSTRHNPEFTLLESYEAYVELEDIQRLVEELVARLAVALYGRPSIPHNDGEIDVSPPWRRLPMLEGIQQYAGVEADAFDTLESARAAGTGLGLDMAREHTVGGIIEKVHERFVQPNLIAPTFITDFPIETSPLAKKRPDNPRLTRRFEGYVAAYELANAFSEINDPIDQRERFQGQLAQKESGDEEAHPMDEDFLRALEYGMPPTGGLGIGIDRLVMVLTNTESIRDVVLFPQMKPER
ncbi:MAG TPA: lysine--tRNA ligase [Armatimonadota bacterium]|nr:lysine--tRNA ligase [Armatimonadota bacterium]